MDFHPLCLGGNVFGWTADEAGSQAVLDAYTAAGGTFIDTANSYSAWVDGHAGGESETVIGTWLAKDPSPRDALTIATKVGGRMPREHGLTREIVASAAENSLRRLQTDVIDFYYAHFDDEDTPLEESDAAFDELTDADLERLGSASAVPA